MIKLLDGLRLDDKSTAALLLAAGNTYDMRAVLEAGPGRHEHHWSPERKQRLGREPNGIELG